MSIQNSLVGMMNTIMGGLAATRFVKGQQESNQIALNKEADSLQQEFLQNKDAIKMNIKEGDELYRIANAGNSGPAHRAGYKDKKAALDALMSSQEKIETLNSMQDRIIKRFSEVAPNRELIGYEDKPMDKLSKDKGYYKETSIDKALNKLKEGK